MNNKQVIEKLKKQIIKKNKIIRGLRKEVAELQAEIDSFQTCDCEDEFDGSILW